MITPIALLVSPISHKNTFYRARIKFDAVRFWDMDKNGAAKDMWLKI